MRPFEMDKEKNQNSSSKKTNHNSSKFKSSQFNVNSLTNQVYSITSHQNQNMNSQINKDTVINNSNSRHNEIKKIYKKLKSNKEYLPKSVQIPKQSYIKLFDNVLNYKR